MKTRFPNFPNNRTNSLTPRSRNLHQIAINLLPEHREAAIFIKSRKKL
ncbi:hypothetical protein HanXRQr2_Chr08g0336761 [Helianthus annuus]|uniref:Uncharacterized protein n=1 Tax=Helianthus annuus TaxID=4232 RepID=A0A9K3IDY6_HELAN|nr:hypothetical protein HanXRQr2_Chr08g0336761 [Helianthus annuus]KAJ0901442.1 hypothetical protein HanPSC8_Chr08g0325351 [Helianthus annuus]